MPSWTRITVWLLMIGVGALLVACRQPDAVTVTRLVETQVTREVPVEVTRIIVRETEATRIVEVTPTPTPIPTGGFVVTTLGEDVTSLNPILASEDSSQFVSGFLFGSMFEVDSFSGAWVCHFCQDWKSENRTVTLTLRDDLLWSDGQPVTVDDFIYTYAALLWGAANERLDSPFLDSVQSVESIAKSDERTVVVTMTTDECGSIGDLNLRWLPQHLYGPEWEYTGPITLQGPFGDADDPDFGAIENSEMNNAPPVSSGPFLFDEWVPGDHVTLLSNPRYFRGAPFLDGLVIRLVPDEAEQVRMLRAGEVDLVERFSPDLLTEVELVGTLQVFKVLDDSYYYLGIQLGNPSDPQPRWLEDENTGAMSLNEAHGEHPILVDPRVRQAIAYGLDRNAIINQVVVGQGVPLYANLLPSLTWAYNSDLEPYRHDPAGAAALLDEAGWVLNEATNVRERDGRPLRLDLKTNSSSEVRVQIGEAVRDQLNGLGFDVRFEAMEWGAFVGLVLGQQFDMVIISWTNLSNNPDDSLFFASQNDTPALGFNFVSYDNPTLDDAWRQAATLPGCATAERAAIYRQVQATLHQDLPYNWLYAPLRLIGANQRLVGINPGPWSTWYNVESWYLDVQ